MFSEGGPIAFACFKDDSHLMASRELLQNDTTAKWNQNGDVFVIVLC